MIDDKDIYKKGLSKKSNIKATMNNFTSTEDGNAEYQISSNLDQHVNTESLISNNLKQHLATESTNKNKLSQLSNLINREDEKNTSK
jgi:hypothetical protein